MTLLSAVDLRICTSSWLILLRLLREIRTGSPLPDPPSLSCGRRSHAGLTGSMAAQRGVPTCDTDWPPECMPLLLLLCLHKPQANTSHIIALSLYCGNKSTLCKLSVDHTSILFNSSMAVAGQTQPYIHPFCHIHTLKWHTFWIRKI